MVLGIIGPKDLVDKSIKIGKDIISVDLIGLPYRDESETLEILINNADKLDGILFTGVLPYNYALKYMKLSIPIYYYPISGSSLYRTLFLMKIKDNIDIERISIDTLTDIDVSDVYEELNINDKNIILNNMEAINYDKEKCIDFHYDLYKSNKVRGVVTSINSVYEELKRLNVPVFKIIPTISTIKDTFKMIESTTRKIMAENKQTAIVLISARNKEKYISDIQFNKLHEMLSGYGKELQASVFYDKKGHNYVMLISKGILEEYTCGYNNIPFVDEIFQEINVNIDVGIGMGANDFISQSNARRALELSISGEGPYLINQDKVVIGPIGTKNQLMYGLKCSDKMMLNLSERVEISTVYLGKIQSLINKSQTKYMTSADIKDGLNISLRSANRIMNKLVLGGIAHPVGREQSGEQGRPKTVYKIEL